MRTGVSVGIALQVIAIEIQYKYPQEANQLRDIVSRLDAILPLDVARPYDLEPIAVDLDELSSQLPRAGAREVAWVAYVLREVQRGLRCRPDTTEKTP